MLKAPLKVALVQCKGTADKAANIAAIKTKLVAAAEQGAKLLVLPECWNSPYDTSCFRKYAENIPNGETTAMLSEVARESKTYIVGGSYPELDDDKVYNTSVVFGPDGAVLGKHRKAHLFDIDVPGKQRFKESDSLTAGDTATTIELPDYGTIGVGICYDIRFPDLAAQMARRNNAFALVYPGAFNTTTGPLHWQLLGRARAVDNQLYVLLASPARNPDIAYQAYGHSQVIDPWGEVAVEAGIDEETLFTTLDPERIKSIRESIPVNSQRRFDIYPDVSKA